MYERLFSDNFCTVAADKQTLSMYLPSYLTKKIYIFQNTINLQPFSMLVYALLIDRFEQGDV
jgi:hypothetical protein